MSDKTIWSSAHLAATTAILMVIALSAFDGLAITAAFPGITEDLGSVSIAPWIFTGYLAASAVAVIVGGPVIDAVGVRRTFRIMSTWFLITSAACAIAPTMLTLIVARIAQGAAGGILTAVALAAIGLTYPNRLHARAFAAGSVVWGVMGFGGPALAGLMLEIGDWRLVFLVQLPLTALAMVAGWNALPSTREAPERIEYDRFGIGLLTIAVIASLVAVDMMRSRPAWAVVAMVVTAATSWGYLRYARTAEEPVLSLDHLTRIPMRYVHLVAVFVLAAGLAANNYLPLYMQIVHDATPGAAAFSVLFLTLGWTAASMVASRLLDHYSAPQVIWGAAVLHSPAILLSAWTIAGDASLALTFFAFFAIGSTIGAVSTSSLSMLQSISAPSEMGRVNSAHQFLRSLAITLGVAIGSAVLFGVVASELGDVEIVRDALEGTDVAASTESVDAVQDAYVWVLLTSAVIGLGAIVSAAALRRTAADAERDTSTHS